MAMVKILVVDDEVGFATALGERLKLRSFDVCLAQSGAQAISMWSAEKPAIVLMDLSLPDMNGLDVMEKIKSVDSSVEVIVLSGRGPEHRQEAKARGAFDYMVKPVKLADLVEVITRAYEHQTGADGG
jgi:DNA-binding NtrC family response regulator